MLNGFYTSVERKANSILLRGYDAEGARVYNRFKFRPYLFTESKDKTTKTEWTSLDGLPLDKHRFDSMSEARKFMQQYEDIPGFRIHGMERWINTFIQEEYPGEIKYKTEKIDVTFLDLECRAAAGFPSPQEATEEITLITLKSTKEDVYRVWGLAEYDPDECVLDHLQKEYRYFETEAELLQDFVNWWNDQLNTPDVISGWNIRVFDIPYLVNRCARILGAEEVIRLSPWGSIEQKSQTSFGRDEIFFKIVGIEQLDYLDLFRKFGELTYGAQESYKLDRVAEVVLGEQKIAYDEEHGSIDEFYLNDPQLFTSYNIKDVELVVKMDEKMNLIKLAFQLSYGAGINFSNCMGPVGLWDALLFRKLADRKIAVPPNQREHKGEYEGAYVKKPIVGKHKWAVTFDLDALYPNMMIQYNMSPETIVDSEKVFGLSVDKMLEEKDVACWAPREDLAITPNGACFRRDKQGIIPEIIEEIYKDRKATKAKMLELQKQMELVQKGSKEYRRLELEEDSASSKQISLKVTLNSCYGACANNFFRYYNLDIAEGITLAGQYVIRRVMDAANEFLSTSLKDKKFKDRILGGDTDSMLVGIEDVVRLTGLTDEDAIHDFCVEFARTAIEPILQKTFDDIGQKTNIYKRALNMKLEKIVPTMIYTAPKRYIMKVMSSEGVRYKEQKMVMKGIEAVKSSTPKICRDEFKTIFHFLTDSTEDKLQERVEQFEKEFKSEKIERIAVPKSVTSVKKYEQKGPVPYIKGTPINSRASIIYNKAIKDLGLSKIYEPIRNGDRLKFVFLKEGNPWKENVIAFKEKVPPEFHLEDWVDWEKMYAKAFRDPLQIVLNALGWKAVPTSSLDSFFE